jgi:cyanophycin synthetase
MLENSLCAAAACLGLGLSLEEVGAGLTSFHNTADQNTGRLNVYDVDGATVIVDYAHNEVGLSQLLRFGATFRREGGRIVSVVGTAGDRPDRSLRELGRVAGQDSDRVILKKTTKYLRGREPDEMEPHYIAGIQDVGDTPWSIEAGEFEAVTAALADLNAGDVLAIMCLEEQERIHRRLTEVGRPVT